MKVVVATIGTRDLMFHTPSGSWYNVGDDRMQDGKIIGEQAEVIDSLKLDWSAYSAYRHLTRYLWENIEKYRDRLKPVIIGKLLEDKKAEIEKVYLIVTAQKPEVKEREKDTLYAGEIIKDWIECLDRKIVVEIIYLGTDDTNPSNFEEMFRWCRQLWREKIKIKSDRLIWLCLKGGVGQTSEALRISGLSFYNTQIQFFEFKQNSKANIVGISSDYMGPVFGANYLWDRIQQQALQLLNRYDYAGALQLLEPYFKQDQSGFQQIFSEIEAGVAWNQGEFDSFFDRAKTRLQPPQKNQKQNWWWMAYEQAYTAVVRLEQKNTAEAMLHSFRAVEGLLWAWMRKNISADFKEDTGEYPQLLSSICSKYPGLKKCFEEKQEVSLTGNIQKQLFREAIPTAKASDDFQRFWNKETRKERNKLSHELGGIAEHQVFQAWGKDIKNQEQWEKRILNCLNIITEQKFESLSRASLFAAIHSKVKKEIAEYELKLS